MITEIRDTNQYIQILTNILLNSCAFICHFSAKEVNFVHIFRCGHGFQKNFIGSLAGSGPEITIKVNAGRVFRLDSTYTTCF